MDAKGKTFVITGANTGIGKASALALARAGAEHIVIASRSRDKTEPVLREVAGHGTKATFIELDLGSLAAVKKAADELLALDLTIDVLMNNAGLAGLRGQTKDGFELAFGTNHLGHWLWTEKLLPHVQRAPQGRIVIVSSRGHYRAKGIDWDAVRKTSASVSAFPEYCVSKLCNVLHSKKLAQRLAGSTTTTYAVHPGGVASDIWQRRMGVFAMLLKPFLITVEEGAKTQLKCATDPALSGESGLYYDDEKQKTPSMPAQDEVLRDELDQRSRAWAGAYL